MMPTFANLGSFIGVDGLIVLVFMAGPLVAIVLFARHFSRRTISGPSVASPEVRLQKLDGLRSTGVITEAEYQDQRRRVLSEI